MLFLLYFLMLVILVPSGAVHAYRHHTSKIRYHEYSAAVFDHARQEGKPVFMNISAVWCYWCKYFDEHTLETEEVSSYLNQHYLSIFVDSDLRMDLTRKYVRGWPMNVLFDPQGRVQVSFPGALRKNDFMDILKRVEMEVRSSQAILGPAVVKPAQTTDPMPVTNRNYQRLLERMIRHVDEQFDVRYGGFGKGRKFPHGGLLMFLLERHEVIQDRRRLAALEMTLEGILRGLYDTVEGGFFRYAEKPDWSEPHTEKMLYVNAPLALVFQKASKLFSNRRYREVAQATASYILRNLYDGKAGGFYGSQTANPAFYQLGPNERATAQKPSINRDKIAAWNAEAILAFLAMGQLSGRHHLKESALQSLEFAGKHLLSDKGAYHIFQYKTGQPYLSGQLEPNAWLARAFLEAYRVTKRPLYLNTARQILRYLKADLYDPKRGAFLAEKGSDARAMPLEAHQFPLDANGMIADAYLLAHKVTGESEYRQMARRILAGLGGEVQALLMDDDGVATKVVADSGFYLRAYEKFINGL